MTTTLQAEDAGESVRDVRTRRSERLALWVFVAYLIVAIPVVLLGVGSYRWFFRDDFMFITSRDAGSLNDLFQPHNAHWSTLPILAFRALWGIFGFRSYLPYQACVLALHLTACALLRVIMRRVGVGPWVATVVAGTFVLFGPGQQNITWAFQIGFTGSLVFGLSQLLLVDHDGPIDWRDGLGVLAGLLALMSSGVGVATAVVVGFASLVRRGWKVALLQTGPLAAAYLGWWLVERPAITSPFGRPPLREFARWMRSGVTGIFAALGHFNVIAVAFAAILAVGLVLAWSRLSLADLRRHAAIPAAMLVGVFVFFALSAQGRWIFGAGTARSSRYVHIGVALVLPALAVALDAIIRRWRPLSIPLLALVLVAGLWNATDFEPHSVFNRGYMEARKRIITNIARMPEASEVPPDVVPVPDPFAGSDLNVGFLRKAQAQGKMPSGSISPELRNELLVRLGVAQLGGGSVDACHRVNGTLDLSPVKGDMIGFEGLVRISNRSSAGVASPPVTFFPVNGQVLTIELDGLDLRLAPNARATSFTLCGVRANP